MRSARAVCSCSWCLCVALKLHYFREYFCSKNIRENNLREYVLNTYRKHMCFTKSFVDLYTTIQTKFTKSFVDLYTTIQTKIENNTIS